MWYGLGERDIGMNQITKRLEAAIDTARSLSPEQQDLLAVELIERARNLSAPPDPVVTRGAR